MVCGWERLADTGDARFAGFAVVVHGAAALARGDTRAGMVACGARAAARRELCAAADLAGAAFGIAKTARAMIDGFTARMGAHPSGAVTVVLAAGQAAAIGLLPLPSYALRNQVPSALGATRVVPALVDACSAAVPSTGGVLEHSKGGAGVSLLQGPR